MKVTLKTIAALADTSPATISRVLTNRGYVNEETRRRIEVAIQESGYTPRESKYVSITQTEKIILVISSNITSQIYIDYFQGLTAYLGEKGYLCLEAYTAQDTAKDIRYLKFANDNHFGAIVLLNLSETPELIRELKDIRCPVVFVNRYLRSADVDAICVDNYRGGYAATKYLIDAGHTRIIHLAGTPTSVVTQDRMLGFHDAMVDAGLPISDENIFQGNLLQDSGEQLGNWLATTPNDFTAVFVSNDFMAVGLLNALHEHGLSVPEDVSIISFDTTPMVKNARVKLTTVGFNSHEMGEAAGEIVYQRMHFQKSSPRRVIYPASIDEGDSVKRLK
ncbi:MAG TPA: LacI family DNA-binding transcriptional regulator [Anaerovoracaceae bacterium]|nr:LacI family DNA-binding transcriptional regulator [Anaerovoracaceae bacterium]